MRAFPAMICKFSNQPVAVFQKAIEILKYLRPIANRKLQIANSKRVQRPLRRVLLRDVRAARVKLR